MRRKELTPEQSEQRRRLRILRANLDYEQADLAADLGVTRAAVGNYENGFPIPAATLAKLRDLFPDEWPDR